MMIFMMLITSLNLFFKLSKLKDLRVIARHTVIGNPKYDEDANFLDTNLNNILKKRISIGFEFSSGFDSKVGPIKYIMKVNQIDTDNLYTDKQFLDCQISLLYNINY